jgi:hypothetical protein
MQTPLTQAWLVPQTLPHAPQLAVSLVRLRQVPEQFDRPDGHTQVPAPSHEPPTGDAQVPEVRGPAEQTVLLPEHTRVPVWAQPPLPAEVHEVPVTRQVPPQFVWPDGHACAHPPLVQVTLPPTGAVQTTPQPPQLPGSLGSARQVPPQFVWPDAQAQVPPAPQTPPTGDVQVPLVRGAAEHTVVVPEHTRVPFWAQPPLPAEVHEVPVTRQVPPQFVWPDGHAWTHALEVQATLPPDGAAHALPQVPQFEVFERVSTSQPLGTSVSQLAKPALQLAMPHAPAEHDGVPLAVEHALPQRPQLPTLVRVSTSQPLAALPSQSAKPVLQVNPHAPAAQKIDALARAAQARPQPPQWATVVLVFTSQPLPSTPSQSPVPAAQVPMAQTPARQMRVPAVGVGQTLVQVPQLLTSLIVAISQPSP